MKCPMSEYDPQFQWGEYRRVYGEAQGGKRRNVECGDTTLSFNPQFYERRNVECGDTTLSFTQFYDPQFYSVLRPSVLLSLDDK